ncbi:IQ motif, EF-hand binding site [Parasponia andersonii]|uniref:IQ motif, EF-hand binding site n=1 Tax=Parasponia andersonii TaxID=3476 RepID=A0A2P5DKQ1_PARAD|nr:IQ motif, EF-hand binding site [Parasponia andersonii]
MGSQPGTPKVKRKWSFGKSAGKGASHKFSKSFDSIDAGNVPVQASAESRTQQNHVKMLAAIQGHVENAAATKIQAAFRSYLARKALYALRGLVKLQALVRGHIVRKQTASTLMRMHALMAIQVRARVQRIQLAEEAELVVRSEPSLQNGCSQDHRKKVYINPSETRVVSKSASDYLNHAQIERINTTLYSGPLSTSKRHQYEEYCFSTAENSPRSHSTLSRKSPTTASSPHQQPNYPDPMSYGYPNYMTNTKSSRAKVRSQSEPRQRPKWSTKQKNKKTDEMFVPVDDQIVKRSSPRCKLDGGENYDSWFIKLYRTRKSLKNKFDSVSTTTSQCNYYDSLSEYEPNFNLY